MKIRSLVLGSVAAAGLSTAGYAADLGVLTSLDVCDQLGLSGLTISSDTNCLQISGGVEYEFRWGNYAPGALLVNTSENGLLATEAFNVPDDGVGAGGLDNDWHSKVKAWVKFVGTAASDFGPASAVIKLQQKQYSIITNETDFSSGSGNAGVVIDEAYVSVGDSTVIMAGKKGSIMNFSNDEPLNFLGLFNSENVDKGVKWGTAAAIGDGGHVIQITTDLGNGVVLAGGLEKLDGAGTTAIGTPTSAGTAFGVISYAGDGIAAHLTVAAAGVLDGVVESWGYHAGFAGTFDVVKFVAAIAGDNSGYWNGLASAAATFDMFTLAASVEAANTTAGTDYGFGISGTAAVTDTVSVNLGGRWYHDASGNDAYQVAAQLVAAVTETITLTGEVGLYDSSLNTASDTFYGAATVAWAPGGGFTTSLKGEAYSNGAYRATFKAAKTFE
ncbi:MAG TPA: hypothetical protein VIM71_11430 [Lacunisphaera sp.]